LGWSELKAGDDVPTGDDVPVGDDVSAGDNVPSTRFILEGKMQ
jgi:hypothetical protein